MTPEKQEILGGLRRAFQFHELPWEPHQDGSFPEGCLALTISPSRRLLVVCRSVLSRPTVEHFRALLTREQHSGTELLFAAMSFTQSFIDSYSDKRIHSHFFSLNGACRIMVPGVITYIVRLQNGTRQQSRNSGGSPFVGKGAMLPRLFFAQPRRLWTQGELANSASMTVAYASIILRRMMENGYVRQEANGYLLVKPEKMLDDWESVYRFNRYVRRQTFAANFETHRQGLDLVAEALRSLSVRFGFMGPSGAYLRAPYMDSGVVMAYAERIPDELPGFFPVESGGNVALFIPQNAGFLYGGTEVEKLPVVSDIQLYLDLKRMPGRNEDQADYLRDTLLNWEQQHA